MSGPKSTARERQGRQEQEALLARLRKLLEDEPISREISMFGARAIMVRGKMLCCARKDGNLLAHIDPAADAEMSRQPGASPAEMGPGREMGPGWLNVAADSIADDDRLQFWLDACLALNRAKTQTQS
ncbi:TfoX/Sxy family protein [Actinomyces massiliensis]|uniref:TfoX/Sxy family protein n=1 Tax=Actinomyces massiliensis TaxID=461393 RepID=UPI0028E3AEB4|nr:TfoX/Sxy family protein [Actinomyces massiliensis]